MIKTSRRVFAVIVAVVAVLAGAPVSAHADGGNIVIPINRVEVDGSKTAAMTGSVNMQVGDCSLNVPSYVSISPPTAAGTMLIHWQGWGYTRHTSHADVWWLYLNFLDSAGNFVISAPRMRGVDMTQWYKIYGWDTYASWSNVDRATFDRIAQVQWIGSC